MANYVSSGLDWFRRCIVPRDGINDEYVIKDEAFCVENEPHTNLHVHVVCIADRQGFCHPNSTLCVPCGTLKSEVQLDLKLPNFHFGVGGGGGALVPV